MSIKIIGAGAIGSLIAGLLTFKGVDACLSNNPEWEKKRTSGTMRITLPDKWLTVEGICFDDSRATDFSFVCLKRHQLESLSEDMFIKTNSDPAGTILFFNCAKENTTHLSIEGFQAQYCITILSAISLQPWDVELTSRESHIICEKNKQLKKLFSLLREFRIKLHMVDDIEPYMNSYFIYQLLSLPVAMCNTTLSHFLSFREGRELALRVLHEGIKTFEKKGKPLQKLPASDPVELFHVLNKKPDHFTSNRYKTDRSFNPLLQSLLLDKKTEAKDLNGNLITMAKDAGVDTSWNWRLLQKLTRVKRFGFYPTPSDLLTGI